MKWLKVRKKPVVVAAISWENLKKIDDGEEVFKMIKADILCVDNKGNWAINTLEGKMSIGSTDYIIKGIKGEFYAIRKDIYEETYEVLEE